MVDEEEEAGEAKETEIEMTMVEPLEEETEVVEAAEEAAVEEAEVATATTIMVEEVVATTMEAEEAEATTMDTRIIRIKETNNMPSHISSNQYLQQCHCLIPQEALLLIFSITTWTAMQIKSVTTRMVDNGATSDHTGRDPLDLVQRASA